MRMIQIQDNISEQKNLKDKLESEQEKLHVEYNKVGQTRRGLAELAAPFILYLLQKHNILSFFL